MKKQLTAGLLIFAILLTMTGCTVANAARKLDAAEEVVEAKLDAAEEKLEEALIPAPTTNLEVAGELTQEQAQQIALDYLGITLEDAQGNVESNRDAELTLSVSGGTLLGFGSAKVRTEAEFLPGHYPSHYGRALAAVRIEDPDKFTIRVCD